MNFRYKLQKIMMGRYGPDELYKFLLWLYILLFIIELIFGFTILNIMEMIIVLIMFYRFFSKNIYKRRKENEIYLKIKKKVMKPFRNIKRNYKDRNYYVYKVCSKCKTTLKLPLPSKRGIQKVKCPTCKKRIKFMCFRQEKIEVIRGARKKDK
mgnify:FL=1